MRVPSGDQLGSVSLVDPLVMRRSPVPSAFAVLIRVKSPSVDTNTILVPSGETEADTTPGSSS